MEGFMVNTTNVNNCAYDIQGYGGRIKDLQESVRSIRTGMRHKLSARGQIERTLRGIEDRMLEEAALMSSLDKALEHIVAAYRRTERDLVTEGIRRSGNGQTVTEQQQRMMDQYMQAAIFDIMQEDQFSQEAWANASIEERKEILNSFLDRMEQEMGISLDEIQFRSGEGLGYNGSYNYADNYISINEALLSAGDPRDALTTLMHESRHAYQHTVCENPDRYLVAADTIQGWQDGFGDYQGDLRDGKYSTNLNEIDAHGFAGQELPKGHVPLAGGIGDGAEMYSVRAEIGTARSYRGTADLTGYGDPMANARVLEKQYGLSPVYDPSPWYKKDYVSDYLYDKYTGYVVIKDGKISPGLVDDGTIGGPRILEGAERVTFYIGKPDTLMGSGVAGAVKMNRDNGSVYTAEDVFFDKVDIKVADDVPQPTMHIEDPKGMGIDDYADGLGAGRYMDMWKFIALKDKYPEEAFGHYVDYWIKGGIGSVKPTSSAVSSTAMDNSFIFD